MLLLLPERIVVTIRDTFSYLVIMGITSIRLVRSVSQKQCEEMTIYSNSRPPLFRVLYYITLDTVGFISLEHSMIHLMYVLIFPSNPAIGLSLKLRGDSQ